VCLAGKVKSTRAPELFTREAKPKVSPKNRTWATRQFRSATLHYLVNPGETNKAHKLRIFGRNAAISRFRVFSMYCTFLSN